MKEEHKKSIRSRIAISLYRIRGRTPTKEEIDRYSQLAEILFYSICGAIGEREQQKRNNQLRIF